jgi:hypothetical protein
VHDLGTNRTIAGYASARLRGWSEAAMPLARYFFLVGGVLLALLFVVDAVAPKLPVPERADTDLPVIRIHSDRKWPERVVFDTSLPTIVPAAAAKAEASIPAPVEVADVPAKAGVRDALALLQPSEPKQLQTSDSKKPEPKPHRKRKIARKHLAPPMMLVAQQPRFGFFGNMW